MAAPPADTERIMDEETNTGVNNLLTYGESSNVVPDDEEDIIEEERSGFERDADVGVQHATEDSTDQHLLATSGEPSNLSHHPLAAVMAALPVPSLSDHRPFRPTTHQSEMPNKCPL